MFGQRRRGERGMWIECEAGGCILRTAISRLRTVHWMPRGAGALAAVVAISACDPGRGQEPGIAASVPVELVYQGAQCGEPEERAHVIASRAAWRAWREQQPSGTSDTAEFDFAQGRIVVIAMGQQRTAGYGLALGDDRARFVNGVLSISVTWHIPGPADIVPQVLTSPCMAVHVPVAAITAVDILKQ